MILKSDLILNHSSSYANYKYPSFIKHKVQDCTQTGLNINDQEYIKYKDLKPYENKVQRLVSFLFFEW